MFQYKSLPLLLVCSTPLFLLFEGTEARSSGPPNCRHKYPEGHGGSESGSNSILDPKGLPVTFTSSDLGNGLFSVEIEGDYIKGFLVRETKGIGSWVGDNVPLVDLRDACATHTGEFASRDASNTNLAFMYQVENENDVPEFEAIAVKDFGTWWHRILFAPGSPMSFGV